MSSATFSPLFSPSQESSPQPSSHSSQSHREAEYEEPRYQQPRAQLQHRAVSDTLLSPTFSLPSSPSAPSLAASASPAASSVSVFSLSPSHSPSPSPHSAPVSASASVSPSASDSPSSPSRAAAASPPRPPPPPPAPLSPRPLLSSQLQRLHASHPDCLQLSLSHNALTSLCSFAPFSSLLTLDLSSNLLTAGSAFPHLSPLLSLRLLSLACNSISSLHGLPQLPSLTSLDLSANQLQPPAAVLAPLEAAVPRLERLSVRGNPLCRSALCGRKQLLQTLVGLQRLTWLDDLPTQHEGAEAELQAAGGEQAVQPEPQSKPLPPRGPTGTQRKADERERKYSTTPALPFSLTPAASASAAVAPLPPGDGLQAQDDAVLALTGGCKQCRLLQRTVGQQEAMLAAQLGVATGGLTVWRQAMQALLLRLQDSEAEAGRERRQVQQLERAAAAERREKEQELQLMRRLWDEGRARLLKAEQSVTRSLQSADSSAREASRREAELRQLSAGCAAVMASTERLREASVRLSSHSRRLQYADSRIAMLRPLRAAESQQASIDSAAEEEKEDDAAVSHSLSSGVDGRELQRLRADRRLLLQREQDSATRAAERERALQRRVDALLIAAAEDGRRLRQQEEELRRAEREKEDWKQRWRLLVRHCTAGGKQSARLPAAAAVGTEASPAPQLSGSAAAAQASRLLSLASLSRQLLQEAESEE